MNWVLWMPASASLQAVATSWVFSVPEVSSDLCAALLSRDPYALVLALDLRYFRAIFRHIYFSGFFFFFLGLQCVSFPDRKKTPAEAFCWELCEADGPHKHSAFVHQRQDVGGVTLTGERVTRSTAWSC